MTHTAKVSSYLQITIFAQIYVKRILFSIHQFSTSSIFNVSICIFEILRCVLEGMASIWSRCLTWRRKTQVLIPSQPPKAHRSTLNLPLNPSHFRHGRREYQVQFLGLLYKRHDKNLINILVSFSYSKGFSGKNICSYEKTGAEELFR